MTEESQRAQAWENPGLTFSAVRGEYTELTESDFHDRLKEIDTFFLLVGFPKTATSTIASILNHQTDIQMPAKKEPFFFPSDEYEFGPGFYWEKYFATVWDGESIVGEAATPNSYVPFVSKRIAETIPNAKIIFSLRNPVDRAFSNWWMYYRSGLENLSFKEAVKWELKEQENDLMPLQHEEDDYWQWYRRREFCGPFIRRRTVRTYLMRGYYALHIKRFLQYFDDENILYMFQDRLHENRQTELNRLAAFLDYQGEIEPIQEDKHVAPKHPLHGMVSNKVLPHEDRIPEPMLRVGASVLNAITKMIPSHVSMDSKTRTKLFELYRDKNAELEKIVGRDLSEWNKSSVY